MEVARTLLNRCEEIVTEDEDRKQQRNTIKTALKICDYPDWTIARVEETLRNKEENIGKGNSRKESSEKNKTMVVLPYVHGTLEELSRMFKKRQITSAMNPHSTLKTFLVHPKDKTDPKEGVYTIDSTGCSKKYVGETKRKLKVRVKERRTETEKVNKGARYTRDRKRQSETEMWGSAITDHTMKENHDIDWDSAKIVERERERERGSS